MLPDTPHMPRWTMVLAVLSALLVAALTIASLPDTSSQPDPPAGAAAETPIGDNDHAMLVALRQHGLWATPVAQQARQMATTPAGRALGGAFAADLENLSGEVRTVAGQLGVALPSQPTARQQAWSAQISGRGGGADYDRTLLSRLRTGCIATAEVVERTRVTTRDPSVRRLADRAAVLLGHHLTLLDPARPAPPVPAQVTDPTAVLASASTPTDDIATGGTATPAAVPNTVHAVSATENDGPARPADTHPAAPGGDRTTIGLAVLVALGGVLTLVRIARLATRRRP